MAVSQAVSVFTHTLIIVVTIVLAAAMHRSRSEMSLMLEFFSDFTHTHGCQLQILRLLVTLQVRPDVSAGLERNRIFPSPPHLTQIVRWKLL